LLDIANIRIPLIGFYDAPDVSEFKPLVKSGLLTRECVFAFYKQWLKGKTLHITKKTYGCGGAGYWLCSQTVRSREDFVKFLVEDEGLKSSPELMNQWLDYHKPYQQEHPNLLIGPLKESQYEFLKSITFFVNPDQLGLLMLGAQYNHRPGDPDPVIAPFGSGCGQLVALFDNLNIVQAVIGTTDIAMRQYLPPDILGFTVTKTMFEELCTLDGRSFLSKPFWKRLQDSRGKKK
jgi:hypothetical protein